MAWRIGDNIVRGELRNTRRNSVHGWLDFGGDYGVFLELTGNFDGQLAGQHIRFQASPSDESRRRCSPAELEALESRQIGVVGTISLRMARIPRCPVREFVKRSKLGETPPIDEKPCLYLEWFSQNGRVVAEIVDPKIEYVAHDDQPVADVEPEPLPPVEHGAGGPQIIGFCRDEDGHIEELTFDGETDAPDPDEDPYGLFPSDLDAQLGAAADQVGDEVSADPPELRRRSWDEIIPGIDEETKRMYEQWDEVFDGEKDEPLSSQFDPPLRLTPPRFVNDDVAAAELLQVLLARLALHGVAFDVCEHCSPREAYRMLMEEILPEAQIHPNLPASGFIQHYSTWETCPQCDAEFEEEYRRRNRDASGEIASDGEDDSN